MVSQNLFKMNSKQTPSKYFFRPTKYFRMLFPKSSSSPWLLSLLNNFESSLTQRLKKLIPQNKDEILTLPWMILAMESLCETHNDINILITDLKLHDMTDSEHQYWVDVYFDITAKLLDLCNAFNSVLNRMNHCIFGLKCLRHNLDLKSEEQCIEIRSTLDRWKQTITAKHSQCGTVLEGVFQSLNFPKVKNFPKAKIFMKAFYAANVLTAYICSVFVIVLSNSDKDFLPKNVSKQSLWKKDFLDLETIVNVKIRDILCSDGTVVLKELECVDAKVKKMYITIQEGDDLVRGSFKDSIVELEEEVEKLDHGLDELSTKIHNFFNVILQGRKTIV